MDSHNHSAVEPHYSSNMRAISSLATAFPPHYDSHPSQRVHKGGCLSVYDSTNNGGHPGNRFYGISTPHCYNVDSSTMYSELLGDYSPNHPRPSNYPPQNYSKVGLQNASPNAQRNIRTVGPNQDVYRNPDRARYEPSNCSFHSPNSGADLQRYHPYDMQYLAHGYSHPVEETQCNSSVKPKRKRANATQLKVLNQLFQQTFFPSTELRIQLGKQLGMSPRTVQIWFQNKRQAWRIRNKFFANKNEKFDDIPSSPEPSAATTPIIASPKSSTCSSPNHSMSPNNNSFQLPPISHLESTVSPDYNIFNSAHRTSNRPTGLDRPLLPSLNEIMQQEPRTIGSGTFRY